MEWIERMNRAMSYVEANLEGELICDEATRLACRPTYHFQRMFASIADVPFSGSVRRRRLTLDAFALQGGKATPHRGLLAVRGPELRDVLRQASHENGLGELWVPVKKCG